MYSKTSMATSDLQRNSLSVDGKVNKTDLEKSTNVAGTKKCLSKEVFTCVALSSIVIGLPIAIIIVLINLPRFSTRRDTRQQHYILLAFGFPFSLVVVVAIVYGVYSLIKRIRQGPDHSKHFRSRMSWRRFSRRLRGFSSRDLHHRHRHSSHISPSLSPNCIRAKKSIDYKLNMSPNVNYTDDYLNYDDSDNEPKLYTLVAQVMTQAQHQSQQQPYPVFPKSCDSNKDNYTTEHLTDLNVKNFKQKTDLETESTLSLSNCW